MHEEWTLSGDNKRAVIRGQAETGRVITAASLIMILVFAAFDLTGQVADMQIGLGRRRHGRMPSSHAPSGRREHCSGGHWWLPAWLDRLLPRFHVEPTDLRPVWIEPQRATSYRDV